MQYTYIFKKRLLNSFDESYIKLKQALIIFAISLLLTGLYMYTGHKLGIFEYKPAFKNLTIDEHVNLIVEQDGRRQKAGSE